MTPRKPADKAAKPADKAAQPAAVQATPAAVQATPAAVQATPAANAETVKPPPAFNFAPSKDGVKGHRTGTKRALTLDLLSRPERKEDGQTIPAGVTFEGVREAIVAKFGADAGWTRRDATEGIRLIHKALGYGLVTDPATGYIVATRNPDPAPDAESA